MDWKGRIVAIKNLPSLHEYVIDAEDNMSHYHILTYNPENGLKR